MDGQSTIYFTVAEHLDQTSSLCSSHQPLRYQVFRLYLASNLKEFEVINVNDRILIAERRIAVAEATHERQTLRETCLTTIKCTMDFTACSCFLTLGATPSGLATTRTVSASNTSCSLVRTRSGSQIREFHCFLLLSPLP